MYHYIIIGAGTAGCVLANRLSADPDISVLLLEAGGPDGKPDIAIPGRFYHLLKSDVDWSYQSEPQPHLYNRRIDLNRGKVLGGTSAINGMVHIRGHRWDYEQWAALGNEGWAYEQVLPFFRKAECFTGIDDEDVYGTDGPLHVAQIPDVLGAMERFIHAGELIGLPRNPNFNGREQYGVGIYHHNYKDGARHTLADAYLKPILQRNNLHVATYAQVTRILFERNRAIGVEYVQNHQLHRAHVEGEVLLCCGGINSPQALLCSGIGPADDLRALDIPVVADLPGVGANLQDHPLLIVGYQALTSPRVDASLAGEPYQQYVKSRSGPLLSTRTFAGAFWKTVPDIPAPDMQVFFNIGEKADAFDFSFGLSLMRPKSRGYVKLRTASPFAYPIIQPNYLADVEDIRVYVDSIRMVRQLVATSAFEDMVDREIAPGQAAQDDEAITEWIRSALATTWHYSGTCRMGRGQMAVVDATLRVHGVEKLRVIDASIMPEIPGGNTNAPVVMIAEKGAALLGYA